MNTREILIDAIEECIDLHDLEIAENQTTCSCCSPDYEFRYLERDEIEKFVDDYIKQNAEFINEGE